MKKIFLPMLVLISVAAGSIIARQQVEPNLKQLTQLAVSQSENDSADAIRQLRARGAEGLQALLDEHAAIIQSHANGTRGKDADAWQRLTKALDAVSQQKDCHASQLYWFTDFEKARAAAVQSGKPILSLRLLGKLDEEFSCANSRFFRTTLYPNPEVSKYLRENFVLHWKSVRPVPRVTIDFGDGRTIERTVTGNSIHYVLDSEGTPIDALPGLYSANAFLAGLSNAHAAVQKMGSLPFANRSEFLRNYHRERLMAVQQDYASDVTKLNGAPTLLPTAAGPTGESPDANRAAAMLVSKSGVERPMVRGMVPELALLRTPIEQQMSDPIWSRIAALHVADTRLDKTSLELVKSKNPTATAAARFAVTKSIAEDPLVRVVANLERSIAEDTVRNRYVLQPRIHNWFINGETPLGVEDLNRRVYAELFLTPDSDPWLGLVPANTFSGLQDDGLMRAAK